MTPSARLVAARFRLYIKSDIRNSERQVQLAWYLFGHSERATEPPQAKKVAHHHLTGVQGRRHLPSARPTSQPDKKKNTKIRVKTARRRLAKKNEVSDDGETKLRNVDEAGLNVPHASFYLLGIDLCSGKGPANRSRWQMPIDDAVG